MLAVEPQIKSQALFAFPDLPCKCGLDSDVTFSAKAAKHVPVRKTVSCRKSVYTGVKFNTFIYNRKEQNRKFICEDLYIHTSYFNQP